MTFSSLVFVCIFLPVVFLLHYAIPSLKGRNALLIAASLLFYAFGEPVYVFLMLGSALCNYLFARWIGAHRSRWILGAAVAVNLGLLAVFKYAGFFMETIGHLTGREVPVPQIALPIGISFFTFQALSYVIDVYRGQTGVQKNFFRVLLYISFFPQLIAGPIVKYRDIEEKIAARQVTLGEASLGMRRFLFGLGKKVLIANAMAVAADAVFARGAAQADALTAWLGALAYTMQIYFDFSAYSDMAIGMGHMFGFGFQENFDFPYAARSVKEFWRRWHISLSSWFKDYVYIPLGGSRKGKLRAGLNKCLVFFLCGLWHGANWTFVVWGLFHGIFSFLEEWIPGLRKLPKVLAHLYTMLVVTVGFVIFRADTIGEAWGMIGRMFTGFAVSAESLSFVRMQLTPYFIVMFLAAVLFCGPAEQLVKRLRSAGWAELSEEKMSGVQTALFAAAFVLLLWCLIRLSGGAYNPFIYFRF